MEIIAEIHYNSKKPLIVRLSENAGCTGDLSVERDGQKVQMIWDELADIYRLIKISGWEQFQ